MKNRKTIQISEEVFNKCKELYPDLSWNSIVSRVITSDTTKDIPISPKSPPSTTIDPALYVSIKEFRALKEKFSAVIEALIEVNDLKKPG